MGRPPYTLSSRESSAGKYGEIRDVPHSAIDPNAQRNWQRARGCPILVRLRWRTRVGLERRAAGASIDGLLAIRENDSLIARVRSPSRPTANLAFFREPEISHPAQRRTRTQNAILRPRSRFRIVLPRPNVPDFPRRNAPCPQTPGNCTFATFPAQHRTSGFAVSSPCFFGVFTDKRAPLARGSFV
jgi:hypothetical protein